MFCLNSLWISYRELLFSVIIDSFIVMFSIFYTTQTGVSPSIPFSTSCHLREQWTTDVIELGWRQQLFPCTAFVSCTAPSAENLVQHHCLASQSSQFCYPPQCPSHTHISDHQVASRVLRLSQQECRGKPQICPVLPVFSRTSQFAPYF